MTNTFTSLAYVIALFSGFIADTRWGLYKTINVGTVVFFIANVVLLVGNIVFTTTANSVVQYIASFGGIALFVLGSGTTKACTSAFLGEQFGASEAQQAKRSRFYSWYYLSIQFGSIGVSLAAPIILAQQPWGAWGLFAILGGAFFVFFPIFLAGSKGFKKRPPQGSIYKTFFAIVGSAIRNRRIRTPNDHWLDPAKTEHDPNLVDDVKAVTRVLVMFSPLPFFWAIFFQMYSVWVAQAQAMNLVIGGNVTAVATVVRDVVLEPALTVSQACLAAASSNSTSSTGGFAIPPATTITLNPLFDCFLIPLFASGIYPLLGKCFKVTALRKMAAGHIFTIAALLTAGFVEVEMEKLAAVNQLVSVFWMIPQYFLVSIAEILLSVTVYEFAYTEAPASMKGLVTGMMFFTIALGNALLAALQLIQAPRSVTNFAYAGAIGLVFILFVVLAVKYQYRQQEEEK